MKDEENRPCEICKVKQATEKHHRYSQSKIAIKKYGRKNIDNPKNIMYLCHECHQFKLPSSAKFTEREFCEAVGIELKVKWIDNKLLRGLK